jgi:hypothetical protein
LKLSDFLATNWPRSELKTQRVAHGSPDFKALTRLKFDTVRKYAIGLAEKVVTVCSLEFKTISSPHRYLLACRAPMIDNF